jgi:hypothetical protein
MNANERELNQLVIVESRGAGVHPAGEVPETINWLVFFAFFAFFAV